MTVPSLTPSVCAVSSSESPRKNRHETTSRSSSRSRFDRGEQLRAPLVREQFRLGGRDRVPRAGLVGQAQREVRAPPRRSPSVAGLVRDDLQQPRPERRAAPEPPERAVGLHEPVLGGLLGVRGVAGDQERGSKRDSLVRSHERLVCRSVSTFGPFDQLVFFEWPVHHRCFYTVGLRAVPGPLDVRGRV